MKNQIFTLLSFFVLTSMVAQNQNSGQDTNIFSSPNTNVLSSFNQNLVGTVGTPFVEDFSLAKVTGFKENYLIRYDGHKDQMQLKNFENQIIVIDKRTVSEVIFSNGSVYKVYDYNLKSEKKNGYLKKVKDNQNFSLLKKETIKFYPAKEAESSYQKDRKATYKRVDDVYLVHDISNNSINSISKKKAFIALFPEKKSAIEKFIKSNKIKFSKEQDLIKLIDFLNSNAS